MCLVIGENASASQITARHASYLSISRRRSSQRRLGQDCHSFPDVQLSRATRRRVLGDEHPDTLTKTITRQRAGIVAAIEHGLQCSRRSEAPRSG
jgi:hypothetical protein